MFSCTRRDACTLTQQHLCLQGPAFDETLNSQSTAHAQAAQQANEGQKSCCSATNLWLTIYQKVSSKHRTLLYRLMLKLSKPVTRQMLTVSLPPGSTASATSSMSSARQAKFTPCCTPAACGVHDVIQKSSVCQRDQDTVLAHVTNRTANTGGGNRSGFRVSQL